MFEHFSLRGIRAAVSAMKKALAEAGQEMKPVGTPAMLQGKKRWGMSAKSPYARARGARFRGYRNKSAHGPGTYNP